MCDPTNRLKPFSKTECFRRFFLLHAHNTIENYFKRKFSYLERQNQSDYLVFRKLWRSVLSKGLFLYGSMIERKVEKPEENEKLSTHHSVSLSMCSINKWLLAQRLFACLNVVERSLIFCHSFQTLYTTSIAPNHLIFLESK